jgi:aspartate/methionine/tyrosine aminotransferase
MTLKLNPNMAKTFAPPVMEARRWLENATFTPERPLLNISQAAPVQPPPLALRQALAEAALNQPQAHLYGPVLGMAELRTQIATRWSLAYQGHVHADQVAITQGCNQAFTAVLSCLAQAGDEIILPTPWYFNHKMFLDMSNVTEVPLAVGAEMVPLASDCAKLITPRTKAIVLVTPNNPTGAEYPAQTLRAFADLAKRHKISLVVDETYRDFDSRTGMPHELFTDPDWPDYFVQLYSFSKAYRLTGHRVGAIVASTALLEQVEKYLDSVAICPSQLGQIAALWGMQNLDDWVATERHEILARRAAMINGFKTLPDWTLLGCGAYFAYVEHPFKAPSDQVAKDLVQQAAVLLLPGTMFHPIQNTQGTRQLRIAFANIDKSEITELFARLAALAPTGPKP